MYVCIYILAVTRQYPLAVMKLGSERKGNRSGKVDQQIRSTNSYTLQGSAWLEYPVFSQTYLSRQATGVEETPDVIGGDVSL